MIQEVKGMDREEVWRDIPGYEGSYQASSFGRVKGIARERKNNYSTQVWEAKIRKFQKDKRGYSVVNLVINCRGGNRTVHRLVAQTFIPNPNNLPQVNHIDGNKDNNTTSNLEWTTNIDNMRHARRNGLYSKQQFGEEAYNRKTVFQYGRDGETLIKEWGAICVAAKETGTALSSLKKNLAGTRAHAGGFVWKYNL